MDNVYYRESWNKSKYYITPTPKHLLLVNFNYSKRFTYMVNRDLYLWLTSGARCDLSHKLHTYIWGIANEVGDNIN